MAYSVHHCFFWNYGIYVSYLLHNNIATNLDNTHLLSYLLISVVQDSSMVFSWVCCLGTHKFTFKLSGTSGTPLGKGIHLSSLSGWRNSVPSIVSVLSAVKQRLSLTSRSCPQFFVPWGVSQQGCFIPESQQGKERNSKSRYYSLKYVITSILPSLPYSTLEASHRSCPYSQGRELTGCEQQSYGFGRLPHNVLTTIILFWAIVPVLLWPCDFNGFDNWNTLCTPLPASEK